MFAKWSTITVADDNYVDTTHYQMNMVTRKDSIASYNFPQKVMFFSHINKVIEEPMTAEFKLVKLTAVNVLGEVFSVVCDDATEIAVSRKKYVSFVKIRDLRSSSCMLIDTDGLLCKIVSIEPYAHSESTVYDVRSNKGNSKFVNGLMFRA